MKFSHLVPNKIIYTMYHMNFVIFFPCFLIKFYVIFTKFLVVLGTWKYFIKFSYFVRLNFISIIDGWNSLSLYQNMSWAGAYRTSMTIWIPIRALISSGLVGYQFLLVLPQCASVLTRLFGWQFQLTMLPGTKD